MMRSEQNTRNEFTIPQKRVGERFQRMINTTNIKGISLENANGGKLVDLPIQVNLRNLFPKVFRPAIKAVVMAISILAQIFGLKIIIGTMDDN